MRKVLIIAYYFPPLGLSGVQRILKFTKYLPEFGWEPIVLTCGNTSYYAYDDGQLAELSGLPVQIYRTPGKTPKQRAYPGRFLQKIGRLLLQTFLIPDSRRRWYKPAMAVATDIFTAHPDIELIFATAPPFTDFLIAAALSKRHNVPFVVDYRDLWTDNPQYFFPTPLHKYRHQQLESGILQAARKAIVISRTMKDKLLKRYKFLSYQDITVIPHGYDAADFEPVGSGPRSAGRACLRLRVTHSGLFPDSRTPKHFLKSVSRFLRDYPDARPLLELHFIGIMRRHHVRLIKRYKLQQNAVLHGYLSHTAAVGELKRADVLWLMLDNAIETPGKLYEYIGSHKPLLLLLPPGELRQIGEQYQAAFIANPKDTKQITAQLVAIFNKWRQGLMPQPNATYADTFNRRYLTSLLSKELAFAIYADEEEN